MSFFGYTVSKKLKSQSPYAYDMPMYHRKKKLLNKYVCSEKKM